MVRYYVLYSNAHRGKIRKGGLDPSHPLIIEEEDHSVPSKGWAEMIRKVYEVNPLLCPECGAETKIIYPTILLIIIQYCRISYGYVFYNLFIFNKLIIGTFFALMIA